MSFWSSKNTSTSETKVAASLAAAGTREILAGVLEGEPGIAGAVVATVDGRAFSSAFATQAEDSVAARIAAVGSSLLALSESFGQESLGSATQYNSIATADGNVVLVRIPTERRTHMLCLWADATVNLAMVLRSALDTAEKVAAVIAQE